MSLQTQVGPMPNGSLLNAIVRSSIVRDDRGTPLPCHADDEAFEPSRIRHTGILNSTISTDCTHVMIAHRH